MQGLHQNITEDQLDNRAALKWAKPLTDFNNSTSWQLFACISGSSNEMSNTCAKDNFWHLGKKTISNAMLFLMLNLGIAIRCGRLATKYSKGQI